MTPHATDATSLVFGLLFLGVAGWWVAATVLGVPVGLAALGWLAAALLVVTGLAGVIGAIRRSRHDSDQSPGA